MTLADRLEKIESSGLIRLAQLEPELEYMFRHALVQDATYESLLKADRRNLHHAVGHTLETLYADRLDEVAATLALHFERAEENEKAVAYLVRAGEAATRVYAIDEASGLFSHALELIPASYPEKSLVHLYSQYGRVLELAGRFDEVLAVYQQMEAEAARRKNRHMELDALMSQAILYSTPSPLHSYNLATQHSEQALAIADELGDRDAQSRCYWMLMLANLFEGHLTESVSYGEKSLEIARSLDNPERLAFVLNDISRTYSVSAMPEKGRATNLEARTLWKKLGNLPMLVDNLGTYAEDLYFRGEFSESIKVSQEAYEIGKSIHNIWGQTFALMVLGFSYIELGEIDRAIQVNKELLSFDARQTFTIAQVSGRGQLADIYSEFGDLEAGSRYALEAFEQAQGLDDWLQASALAGEARFELVKGNYAAAEQLFEKATRNYDQTNFITFIPQYVEDARNDILIYRGKFEEALLAVDKMLGILDRLGILQCRPEFMLRKANTLAAMDGRDEALLVADEAILLCQRLGAHRLLWKLHALVSRLQAGAGRAAEAQQALLAARGEIDFLATRCPQDLRASFLQLPAVQAVLDSAGGQA